MATLRENELRIDARRGIALAGANVPLRDVVAAAAAAHLVPVIGAGPDPGVPARTAGLAARAVRAVVVDDGRIEASEPDAFWAALCDEDEIRGYELALAPAPGLTAGALMWPSTHAHRILHEWRAWSPEARRESVARIVRTPALPWAPRALRGRALVVIEAAHVGTPYDAAVRFGPLRRLEPEIDTIGSVSAATLREPRANGAPRVAAFHVVLDELPAGAIEAIVACSGPGIVSVDLHDHGYAFAVVAHGVAGGEDGERSRIAFDGLARRLAPWSAHPAERRAA